MNSIELSEDSNEKSKDWENVFGTNEHNRKKLSRFSNKQSRHKESELVYRKRDKLNQTNGKENINESFELLSSEIYNNQYQQNSKKRNQMKQLKRESTNPNQEINNTEENELNNFNEFKKNGHLDDTIINDSKVRFIQKFIHEKKTNMSIERTFDAINYNMFAHRYINSIYKKVNIF